MTPELPRDHPCWPAFKRWADDNTPGLMLHVYWACWLAANEIGFAEGFDSGRINGNIEGRLAGVNKQHTDHSTLTPEDLPPEDA